MLRSKSVNVVRKCNFNSHQIAANFADSETGCTFSLCVCCIFDSFHSGCTLYLFPILLLSYDLLKLPALFRYEILGSLNQTLSGLKTVLFH